jgi:DNA-binding response OmpR family regulator
LPDELRLLSTQARATKPGAKRMMLDDSGISSESGQIARILVVDDDPAMRQMVVSYLEEQNMRAVPAAGRQEMVRQLAGYEPSLVILDLGLRKDDGLDLLREIRSRSDVPVIGTTGYRCDEVDCVVALELGADDYLIKPFGLRELLAHVRAVLRRRVSCCPLEGLPHFV